MQAKISARAGAGLSLSLFFLIYNWVSAQTPPQPDFAAVDEYLRSEMSELKIPGLEAVVVQGDQVVYMQGFGIADASGRAVTPQTPMLLGSVSKGFTAMAVMQLVEAGKIDLDAPIGTYLPWFRMSGALSGADLDAWKKITIRQLLHHTSGIPGYTGENTWNSRYSGEDALEQQVRSFANIPLNRLPGEDFEYSNANYQILGLIVQTVSGQFFEEYLRAHIFQSLGMRNSYALAAQAQNLAAGYRYWFGLPLPAPDLPIPRAHAPSAMLISTAEDMGNYLIAQMNGGKYAGAQVLSEQGTMELHSPAAAMGGGNAYAMGWVVEPDGSLGHNGETPGATSGLRIEGQWGVFVVRNISANQRQQRLDEIAPGVLALLQGRNPAKNVSDPSFRRKMVALAVLFILQAVGSLWSIFGLARRTGSLKHAPLTIFRLLWSFILPLLISLGLAALLWYMGPVSSHRTFSVQMLSAPDQMLLLGANIVLAILNASLVLLRWLLLHTNINRPVHSTS